MADTVYQIRITEKLEAERLDRALAVLLPELSRSRIQALMSEGRLRDNAGAVVQQASRKVIAGEVFHLNVPPPVPAEPQPQDIALDIVHEDADLIVINKPVGLVVHPAAGNWDGTLVNALLAHCGGELAGIGGVERPGIVHRIDKDTTGLIVVAKTERAHNSLSKQFAVHSIERLYTAFVWGVPRPTSDRIEGAVGRSPTNRRKMALARNGKPAVTHYKTLAAYGDLAAKIECRLETGRTHQIRVHLTARTHPLIGDPLYGKGRRALRRDLPAPLIEAIESLGGQALHAGRLGFTHPASGKAVRFESELPAPLKALEAALGAL